ncbi:MAG TPA: glucokinase [Candidatus Sumerlaeota bacterium]|nr:glucokinase [Candidatus Sumerlaeota bacterium]HOR29136.1 glucokinase [Candidatus Sumerlaeota bacterium]HPK03722.1 glucokinase [Candidatus Sumerlaeota bacterium]
MSGKPCLLAGDVGGTKVNVACFDPDGDLLTPLAEASYATADVAGLADIARRLLGDAVGSVAAACFGVAGAVIDRRAQMVNVPWPADARDLERLFGHDRVDLINDLVALAYGVLTLRPRDLAVLHAGDPLPGGNKAVIAAGTGLGESMLFHHAGRYYPSPSEGGHADFSPNCDEEIDLLRYMMDRIGRTSTERLLSGPGLVRIHEFLRDTGREEEPDWLAERLRRGDASAEISQAALERRAPICERALDLFVRIYGAEAGDLALTVLATGGVYLGGGIAPKILPRLREGPFMEAFHHKGRLSEMMARIPVHVVLEPRAPLFGAAWRARELLRPVG